MAKRFTVGKKKIADGKITGYRFILLDNGKRVRALESHWWHKSIRKVANLLNKVYAQGLDEGFSNGCARAQSSNMEGLR